MRAFFPLLFGSLTSLLVVSASAQTFTGGGGVIPDNNTTTSYNLNVSGLASNLNSTTFGLEQVCLTINHTWDADLEVSLRSPNNTTVILFSGVGGDGDNFTGTCLRQSATTSIVSVSAPFSGTFRPQNNLAAFNNGQNGNGQWRLRIRDMNSQDQGTLVNWSITFSNQPAQPFVFESSNLPILLINTNNVTIPDDPKIAAGLKIIYNGPGERNYITDTTYDYNGQIGIERRGSTSQGMPKKPYGFETWDNQQNDIKVSLLGMPEESDWILTANYSDKTLMRNALSYELANQTGHYAPRTRFCEVMLNGQYDGVYLLCEKIKRDSGRVDISKLRTEDISGEELTGGYIVKIDKMTGSGGAGWSSAVFPPNASGNQSIFFQYVYPKPDSIQPQQAAYIKSFVDSFETVLNNSGFQNPSTGWRKYMDENSVIDFFLINEMSRNVDGYRISTFLHKEKITKGGKLKMGPVWDYDIAWQNADYCSGQSVTGWAYNFNNVCNTDGSLIPFWWQRFRQDTLFNKRLYCRWSELRQSFLHTDSLRNRIDTIAAYLNEGQERNFTEWPILGTYVWPNPSPIPTTYLGEIAKLKQWVTDRLGWMDGQINTYQTPLPVVELGPDTAICIGEAVFLDAGNPYAVLWSTGQTDTAIYAGTAGDYSVEVESLYGCHSGDSIHIAVNPLPDAQFSVTTQSNFTFDFTPAVAAAGTYLWNFGDGNTSSAENPEHTYTQAGNYTVTLTVTDSNGCSAQVTHAVQTQTVSVQEVQEFAVSVYPNPFREEIHIRRDTDAPVLVRLVSISGKVLFERQYSTTNIDIVSPELTAGMYYLWLKTEDGQAFTRKLIKTE